MNYRLIFKSTFRLIFLTLILMLLSLQAPVSGGIVPTPDKNVLKSITPNKYVAPEKIVKLSHTFNKSLEEIYSDKNIYCDVYNYLKAYNEKYPVITKFFSAGLSADSREIPIFQLGTGEKKIFINAEHHAREYITAILVLNQIQLLLDYYDKNLMIENFDIRKLLNNVSIYFMPMVNPDGIELCTRGPSSIKNSSILKNISSNDFSLWKSNSRGVDLNRNYDAQWGYSGDKKDAPSGIGYPGTCAFSEPETQAIKLLCEKNQFSLSISYHTCGDLIYWYCSQSGPALERDKNIAAQLKKLTGYALVSKEASEKDKTKGSFKDWFIEKYKKPSFTIEVDKPDSKYPITFKDYNNIWEKNKYVPIYAASAAS